MGSVGNQNPWAPYDSFRDCSLGICSIYCPQFCYLIFPPPPPSDDDSTTPFSPLIIAIIGVLASAVLLVSYYTIVTRYCKRRGNDNDDHHTLEENRDELSRDTWQVGTGGLDEVMIKNITVCKYKKGDGLIEGTECAVCLSEFQENESLRLLPKCSHAFHLPCIDVWLKSHSNCPLCRANVVALANPSDVNVSSYEIRRPDDLILVVDDQERAFHEQIVVVNENDDGLCDQEGVEQFRRSVSFSSFSPQRQLLVSDILRFEEIDEYMQVEVDQLWRGIGSSKGDSCVEESKSSGNYRGKDGRLLRSPVAMKRSISTGRFMGKVNDKGKSSIVIPN